MRGARCVCASRSGSRRASGTSPSAARDIMRKPGEPCPRGRVVVRIEEDGVRILASGECADCDLGKWISLDLGFEDGKASATVNGKAVGSAATTAKAGMMALATGWHVGEFDNFAAA